MVKKISFRKWKRVGKSILNVLFPVGILLLVINSFRFGWIGFTIVTLFLLALVWFTQKEIIMNTAEIVQIGLWGRHMTLPELKGKKVKFIWKRGKKHGKRKSKDVETSKKGSKQIKDN